VCREVDLVDLCLGWVVRVDEEEEAVATAAVVIVVVVVAWKYTRDTW